MQYAKVYVFTKTNELDKYYYYKIPAKFLAYIKKYILVEVPFARSYKKALVVDIVRNVDKNILDKLKSIHKIIFKFGVLDDRHMYIAKKLSVDYFNNIGQILDIMTPQLSKKVITKSTKTDYLTSERTYSKYMILDNLSNRYKYYIKIIEKTLQSNKSALVILPDLDMNKLFIDKCKKTFDENIILFDNKLNIAQRTKNWQALKDIKKIIIGTRNTIFRIPQELGCIIIHEPHHIACKQESNVYYHALNVANIIAGITRANLFIGQNIEYPQDVHKYKIIKNNFLYYKKAKFVTINKYYELISPRIKSIVKSAISERKNLLIIAQHTEESSGLICSDCKHIFYCDRCERIERKISETKKQCPVCKKISNIPYGCPNCKSTHISKFGETAKNIYDKLSLIYKNKVHLSLNPDDCDKKNIVITSKYVAINNTCDFDRSIILDWESFIAGGNMDQNIHIANDLLHISSFSKKYIYIQTKNIEDEKLFLLTNKNIKQYYKNELVLRKNYNLPPYKKIIKFSCKNAIRSKGLENIKGLKKNLTNVIDENLLSINEGQKIREKYHFSIILKTDSAKFDLVCDKLRKNYKTLKLSNFQIDVEPISLV